jgi:hypothetical protein
MAFGVEVRLWWEVRGFLPEPRAAPPGTPFNADAAKVMNK